MSSLCAAAAAFFFSMSGPIQIQIQRTMNGPDKRKRKSKTDRFAHSFMRSIRPAHDFFLIIILFSYKLGGMHACEWAEASVSSYSFLFTHPHNRKAATEGWVDHSTLCGCVQEWARERRNLQLRRRWLARSAGFKARPLRPSHRSSPQFKEFMCARHQSGPIYKRNKRERNCGARLSVQAHNSLSFLLVFSFVWTWPLSYAPALDCPGPQM